jgi:hypothetical protein
MIKLSYLNDIRFILLLLILILISVLIYRRYSNIESFQNSAEYKNDAAYQTQVKLLSDRYDSMSNAKRPITELLKDNIMPVSQQCFVNFYSLGCRYTGYIGPMDEGYWDPDIAVQMAVKAGCRTFILEIDYLDGCTDENLQYFPRIVVRDAQGKLRINSTSNKPRCNSPQYSSIKNVCKKINYYAFADGCQNRTDPVIIVLYFLRKPPGAIKSKTVLDYFSNVAKGLSPFSDRLLKNELEGGTYNRQSQEGRLLINNINNYSGKVLIFNNANTSGFRETQLYLPNEDLDFLTNLRLTYTQSNLGITETGLTAPFGILETAENYTIIPQDREEETIESTKLRWTICLSKDPSIPVSKEIYDKITGKFGINCVPTILFDNNNNFMYMDNTFKTYSFMPKPESLRYIKPPVVIPGEANPITNANGGMIREPEV